MRNKVWLPIVVGVAALLVGAVAGAIFSSPVTTALASTLTSGGPWHGGGHRSSAGFTLPPELKNMMSIPANQRFDHFAGAQVNLKDQNNQPLTINVIPGKVADVSTTSLSITANSGSAQTFTLNGQTMIHSIADRTSTPQATPAASTSLQKGDDVVVVTLNSSTTATAVIAGSSSGFAMPGRGGW